MDRADVQIKTDISVVIPLFNKVATIRRAVLSVLEQSITPDAIVVVDDGSTDESLAQILDLSHKITLIRQDNEGVSAARNRGVSSVDTRYVAFLDADDWWEAGAVAAFYSLKEKYGSADMFTVAHYREDDHTTKMPSVGVTGETLFEGHEFLAHYAYHSGLINSSSVCLKKEALISVGQFPLHYDNGEDVYVWVAIALKGPVAFTPVRLVHIEKFSSDFGNSKGRKTIPAYVDMATNLRDEAQIAVNLSAALTLFFRRRGLLTVILFSAWGRKAVAWAIVKKLKFLGLKFRVLGVLACATPSFVIKLAHSVRSG